MMHKPRPLLLLACLLSSAVSIAATPSSAVASPTAIASTGSMATMMTSWVAPLASTASQIVAAQVTSDEQETLAQGDHALSVGDYARAIDLFTPLAERGNGYAQAMLSRIYGGQPGAPQDDALALKWAQTSADQNDPDGLLALAALHYTGVAVEKDLSKAADIVERAANAGSAKAQAELGLMYAQGEGRKQDAAVAEKWLSTAAKQGQWNAQIWLGRLVLNKGTALGADLPPVNEPSERAKRKPVPDSVKQSADAGDADAKLEVARGLYAAALHDVTDVPEEVVKLVEQAAADGHAMAQFAAGALHSDGFRGIPNDAAAAKAWFDKGVEQLP